jgi:TPR repeat protein
MDSATPSLLRPFFEFQMNMDGLGREIYNNRQTRVGDAYTGGDSIPELWKDAAKTLYRVAGVDWSPNTLYFFANNYADGLTRIAQNGYNLSMLATGEKEFNPRTDTILFDSFFGAKSNFDARAFSLVEKQIKEVDKRIKTLETDPEKYIKYVGDNPNAVAAVEFYNKAVNQDLKTLRSEANRIRGDRTYTPKERKEMLDNITQMSNMVKRNLLFNFETLGYTP